MWLWVAGPGPLNGNYLRPSGHRQSSPMFWDPIPPVIADVLGPDTASHLVSFWEACFCWDPIPPVIADVFNYGGSGLVPGWFRVMPRGPEIVALKRPWAV